MFLFLIFSENCSPDFLQVHIIYRMPQLITHQSLAKSCTAAKATNNKYHCRETLCVHEPSHGTLIPDVYLTARAQSPL